MTVQTTPHAMFPPEAFLDSCRRLRREHWENSLLCVVAKVSAELLGGSDKKCYLCSRFSTKISRK
jgi:hypothetical protein